MLIIPKIYFSINKNFYNIYFSKKIYVKIFFFFKKSYLYIYIKIDMLSGLVPENVYLRLRDLPE